MSTGPAPSSPQDALRAKVWELHSMGLSYASIAARLHLTWRDAKILVREAQSNLYDNGRVKP